MDFSIVIVTNRDVAQLSGVLSSCLSQEDCALEAIVVLNGVRPPALPEREKLRFVALAENRGAVARNEGFRAARGRYLVCIDDDVRFESMRELARLREFFEHSPDAGAVDFKVLAPGGGLDHYSWCHPRDRGRSADETFETHYISEGAVAFRRETFETLGGGYYEPLFIGHEGEDLALRMIDKGLRIVYYPGVRVVHEKAEAGRAKGRSYYYNTRNGIWIAWKNFPCGHAIALTARTLALMTFFTLRSGNWSSFGRGIRDGLGGIPRIWKDRVPLGRDALRRLREIRSDRPSVIARIRTHLAEKVI